METWEMFEKLRDIMGAEELLDELARGLSDDDLRCAMVYIARMNDIELEEE